MIKLPKVLVVGCGMTGSSIYHYLSEYLHLPKECVTFWEKSNSIGGRMGKVTFEQSSCDMGAQYITKSSDAFDDVYNNLLSHNIFKPLNVVVEGMKPEHLTKTHYISQQGLSSISEHFIRDILNKDQIRFNTALDVLNILPTGELLAQGLETTPNSQSHNSNTHDTISILKQIYDIVIITTPTNTIQSLKGNFISSHPDLPSFVQKTNDVKYSSRYALAVFYDRSVDNLLTEIPWAAKYVFDNDVIRYVSIESRKHNTDSSPISILIHTSIPFGIQNENNDQNIVKDLILKNLKLILPELSASEPLYSELLYWKISQVSKGINWNSQQASAVFPLFPPSTSDSAESTCTSSTHSTEEGSNILYKRGIVFASDYFTESNFEGCLKSSQDAVLRIKKDLTVSSSKTS